MAHISRSPHQSLSLQLCHNQWWHTVTSQRGESVRQCSMHISQVQFSRTDCCPAMTARASEPALPAGGIISTCVGCYNLEKPDTLLVISVSPAYSSNVPPTQTKPWSNTTVAWQQPIRAEWRTGQQSHLAAWAGSLPLRICTTAMQQSLNPINRFRYVPLSSPEEASIMPNGLKLPPADQPRLATVRHSCICTCMHACMHATAVTDCA
jgi:hypothetical protein